MTVVARDLVVGDRAGAGNQETLSQQVYLNIRQRIYRGEWVPGTKLTLRGLAHDLGTSVQPIRDAIGRLHAERALILRPNHSVQLPPLDITLMDEIFSVRNLLEGEAARLSAVTLTESDFEELRQAIETTRVHYIKGADIQERILALNGIASLLAIRSASNILAEQIIALRVRTAPYYAAAMASDDLNDPDFIVFTTRMQDEFLAALRRRDAVSASEIRKVELYTYKYYVYRLLKLI